ncbi:MAG: LacI family DNA-binding transcriptional regulator [Melioribacteraceae bacterium]|nr:LacI family DNA-binding transcriptional regulator [Melioribacteraceae bacterium]
MNKRVTLKDIAKVLNVTPATVSKALRECDDISKGMQKTVKETAGELGYRPNILARSLINKKSKLLGVVIPDLRISFFTEVTRGIYEEASKLGYEAILMVHDENPENEKKKLEFLSDINVDGILIASADSNENLKLLETISSHGIKIVAWDRKIEGLDFPVVHGDDRKAAFNLTSEIIKQGRKKIAFIGATKSIQLANDRINGFIDAHKHHGISLNENLIVPCERKFEASFNEMKKTLEKINDIDAVVCFGGVVAYGAGSAILELDKSIPDDIMLGEFGDNSLVTRLGVSYYTVNQNPYRIGIEAVNLIVKCIESDGECQIEKDQIIETKILYRNVGARTFDN